MKPDPAGRAAGLWLAVVLATLAACTGPVAEPRTTPGDATTPTPAPTSTTSTTVALIPATTPSCPTIPPRAGPDPARPRYRLDFDADPLTRTAAGTLEVVFTPDLDTDRLVFRLWPNGPLSMARGTRLTTGLVRVDGRVEPAVNTDPTTMVVASGRSFAARRPVTIAFDWALTVAPVTVPDRISATDGSLRLGSFFPILAWEPARGWALDAPTDLFAEAAMSTTADFDLTVRTPPGYTVLASGVGDRPGHWRADAMRDVAVSVGRFNLAAGEALAPHPVTVTVGAHDSTGIDPTTYLAQVMADLADLATRYGPYPWTTFSLALTPALPGGIEYPTHVMQGAGTLGRVISHELGHQWFYALVGNNQARHPWLDEGLATWAEGRARNSLGAVLARPVPEAGRFRVGEPMDYWAQNPGAYYAAVYNQGAAALAALGDPVLVDCALALYAAVNAHRIARPADLVAAAHAVFPDAPNTLAAWGISPVE
ncbi:MAG: M1 family aminopeptidase [Acidimicrobiales bacterium]